MSKENGGPAFPVLSPLGPDGYSVEGYPYPDSGMTLRDYFAAHAPSAPDDWCETLANRATYVYDATAIALWRFEYADAMIKARGETH